MNFIPFIYYLSRILCYIAIAIQSVTALVFCFYTYDCGPDQSELRVMHEIYSLGAKIRNIVLVFVALMIFVGNKSVIIGERNILESISVIGKSYGKWSLALLITAILSSFFTGIWGDGKNVPGVKEFCKYQWRTAICSMLFGFMIAFFFEV